MSECRFRNALIGKNRLTDSAWPFLNDSNNSLKNNNNQATNGNPSPTPSGYVSSVNCLPASSQHVEIRISHPEPIKKDCIQLENNFPKLSVSALIKSTRCIPVIESSSPSFDGKIQNTSSDFVYKKTKTPIFKKEINISLSSLIKVREKKKKIFKKSIITKNTPSGNKLDGDAPTRRKGKFREVAKKHLTKHKKDIILSKSLKKKVVYDQVFYQAKCLVPSLLNSSCNFDVEKLATLLNSATLSKEGKGNKACIQDSNDEADRMETKMPKYEISKNLLHSKKFKKYCSNLVTEVLLKCTENLIVRLRSLQDKQHAKDPSKTFSKRRYLCGFRETKRFIICDSVKAVIIATDLDLDLDLPSGQPLNEVIELAKEKSIPIIFAGKIKQLSYWTFKKKISIISILRYEGAEQLYCELISNLEDSKKSYENILEEIEKCLPQNILTKEEIPSELEKEIRHNIISKLSTNHGRD